MTNSKTDIDKEITKEYFKYARSQVVRIGNLIKTDKLFCYSCNKYFEYQFCGACIECLEKMQNNESKIKRENCSVCNGSGIYLKKTYHMGDDDDWESHYCEKIKCPNCI